MKRFPIALFAAATPASAEARDCLAEFGLIRLTAASMPAAPGARANR